MRLSRVFTGVVAVVMGLFVWWSSPAAPFLFPVVFVLLGVYLILSGLFRR